MQKLQEKDHINLRNFFANIPSGIKDFFPN